MGKSCTPLFFFLAWLVEGLAKTTRRKDGRKSRHQVAFHPPSLLPSLFLFLLLLLLLLFLLFFLLLLLTRLLFSEGRKEGGELRQTTTITFHYRLTWPDVFHPPSPWHTHTHTFHISFFSAASIPSLANRGRGREEREQSCQFGPRSAAICLTIKTSNRNQSSS